MIRCPHCQAALTEEAVACPACGFSYRQLDEEVGVLPVVQAGLTDTEKVLRRRQAGMIRRKLGAIERQFPQMKFSVVLTAVEREVPISRYAFRLFNGAHLCSTLHKGGLNFHQLLVIDIDHRRAHLAIGYGLEPFITDEELRGILGAGASALEREEYGECVMSVLRQAPLTWQAAGERIPEAFGLRRRRRVEEDAGW